MRYHDNIKNRIIEKRNINFPIDGVRGVSYVLNDSTPEDSNTKKIILEAGENLSELEFVTFKSGAVYPSSLISGDWLPVNGLAKETVSVGENCEIYIRGLIYYSSHYYGLVYWDGTELTDRPTVWRGTDMLQIIGISYGDIIDFNPVAVKLS